MGYKPGKGLSKQLQGISIPVEVRLRKERSVDAYGLEKTPKIPDIKK